MSNQSRRTQRASRPRLEFLESRALLSVIGAPAGSAAEVSILAKKPVHVQTIRGSLDGQGVVTAGNDVQGQESLTATGQAASLGTIAFSGQLNYQANVASAVHTVSYSNGSGTITAQGGQIFVSFAGSGKHRGPSSFSLSLHGSLKGGTGQFAGATGSLSGKGSLNDQAETFSLSFTLKLSSN
jgi:hypothetical protein